MTANRFTHTSRKQPADLSPSASKERVNNGSSKFSTLALLYSEDKGTARNGGELGPVGRGELVPEFANVAFNLTDPKAVSKIVETEYGFHIIQLVSKSGDRVTVRHILRKPRVSDASLNNAVNELDSLAGAMVNSRLTSVYAPITPSLSTSRSTK